MAVEIKMAFTKLFLTLMAATMQFLLTTKHGNKFICVQMQTVNITLNDATHGFPLIMRKFGQLRVMISFSLYITRGHPLLISKKPTLMEATAIHYVKWKTMLQ